ncbi:protein FAM183A [Oreochromis aureus]|uniref:protein FAM183A n=1 Tax=Oreochromis aureus TaxID=47969 RepID=UPI0012BD5D9E|nr:protein FAM183A [Oreochromis aureus]
MADKDKLDLVHRDAIHAERVRKEQRHQKLHTEFSINPHRKLHVLPDKPMCRRTTEVIPEDEDFIKAFRKAHEVPTKKYSMPLTESQEIGWMPTPLVPESRQDTRLNFFRFMTDVTKHHELGQKIKLHTGTDTHTQKRENKD